MRPRLARRSCAIAVSAVGLVLTVPAAGAPPPALPGCERLVTSPGFDRDGKAFCFGVDYARAAAAVRVYATSDRARTWKRLETAGLPATATRIVDAVISPLFASDGLVVAQFDDTVYYSVDSGVSFRTAPVRGPVALAAAKAPVPGLPATPAAALNDHGVIVAPGATVGAAGSVVFDPTLATVRLIGGTGAKDRRFAVSPRHHLDGVAFAVGAVAGESAFTAVDQLFGCDMAFNCRTELARFPAGEAVDRIWFPADYEKSRVLFATTIAPGTWTLRVFVSRNGGASFTPLTVLQRAVTELQRLGVQPAVALTGGRHGSRTVYARVSGGTQAANPPSERLYRSDDGGTSWRLVSYGRMPTVKGPRGTMPYAYAYGATDARPTPLGLLTYAGGRLLMTGGRWSPLGYVVWCSANGGTRWAAACP